MRRPLLLATLPLLLVAVALAAGFWAFSYDDAFITYRYAENFARHGELTYNRGETVLGTSAPGYGLLLGVLARLIPIGVPAWGTVLGYLSLLLCALLAGAGRPVISGAATTAMPTTTERIALPLLFGLLVLTCRWNIEMVGAETLPILALAGAAAHLALVRDRPRLAGLAAGLAIFLRLDALLLAGAVGLLTWVRRRRFPTVYAIAAGLVAVPFLIWLQVRFHTIVPQTLGAKRSELPGAGFDYTLAELAWLRRCLPTPAWQSLCALSLWETAVLGRRVARRRDAALAEMAPGLAIFLWLVLQEAAYRRVGVPFAPWYHVGALNGLLLLAALGALDCGCRLSRFSAPGARRGLVAGAAGWVLALTILLPAGGYVAHNFGSPPDPRYRGYRVAGELIREDARHADSAASVAAVEIGFVGYWSEAQVLDLMGLVSPAALAARRRGTTAELVLARRPDYIVDATLFKDSYLRTIEASPAIAALYERIADLPDDRDPAMRVRVLKRKAQP